MAGSSSWVRAHFTQSTVGSETSPIPRVVGEAEPILLRRESAAGRQREMHHADESVCLRVSVHELMPGLDGHGRVEIGARPPIRV